MNQESEIMKACFCACLLCSLHLTAAKKSDDLSMSLKNDLVIRSVNLVDVESLKIEEADVVVRGSHIHKVFRRPSVLPDEYCAEGIRNYDAKGLYLLPGMINSHVHIESSHILPREFGETMACCGTTSAVCDPHEIVNVAGEEGLAFMIENAKESIADLFYMLPSCVPATSFETCGAVISSADTKRLFHSYPELLGLGEMMNFPGVINGDKEVMGKIDAALSVGKLVDGHFPLGSGEALRAYAKKGISSDHESVTGEEAIEKVACGMDVFIREGSSAKNLKALIKVVTKENFRSFSFCNDDITAGDVLKSDGILGIVRSAVALGFDPLMAIAMGSVNSARHFRLSDRGILKEGMLADMILVNNPEQLKVVSVFKNGREIKKGMKKRTPVSCSEAISSSVRLPADFKIVFPKPETGSKSVRIMSVNPTELITEEVVMSVEDYLKEDFPFAISADRHGSGTYSSVPVSGTGMKKGAIAQTIAHDTHNIIVVGKSEDDMTKAVRRLAEIQGGVVVVENGKVLAEFPLPYGGLMTGLSPEDAEKTEEVVKQAISSLGCTLPSPIVTLSFLSLPVIPKLKITNNGLVDVESFKFVPVFF